MDSLRFACRRASIARALASEHWPYLAVTVAPLILFWRFIFAGRVLFWGLPLLQFYPWRWLAVQQIRAGEWPLWNPYLGNGAPLLANYQTAVLYPPNWLGLILPLDYSLGFVAVLHVMWAGAGMVAFARLLGLNRLGQAIAGLAFSLSGYLIARMSFITIVAAAAWLPWELWASERLAQALAEPTQDRRRSLRCALTLTGIVALQLLAGHAQTTFYSLAIAGLWMVWRIITNHQLPVAPAPSRAPRERGRGRRRSYQLPITNYQIQRLFSSLALFAFCLLFAAGLTAAQLLPTAELLRQTPRAEAADYDFVVTYSFWPWRILTFLAPDTFGNPARGDYWGYGNYWEDAAYLGVLPLGLSMLALVEWMRQWRKSLIPNPLSHTPFLLALAFVSLLLALGQNTPVFRFLHHNVPTFDLFQAPARMMIGWVTALSLLAGIGAEAWRKPEGGWLYWTRLGVAGGVAITIAALLGTLVLPRPQVTPGTAKSALYVFQTFPRAAAIAGVLVTASFALSLLRGGRRWERVVAAFVALDLIVAGYGLNPAAEADLYRRATALGPALSEYLDGHRLYQFAEDEYQSKYQRFFRFDSFGPASTDHWLTVREAQMPNVALLEGIASANNFDPLIPQRQARLLEALQRIDLERAWAVLGAMDVRAVVSATPLPNAAVQQAGEGFAVYRVPRPSSRIRISYFVQVSHGPEQSLEAVTDPGFDPDLLAVIERPDLDIAARPRTALCRSSLFDGLTKRYQDQSVGGVIISGQTICQYYVTVAEGSVNRSLALLAELPKEAGFGGPPGSEEDVLGPFEALGSPPPGRPIVLTESPTQIRIAAPMEYAGYVTLADANYPGWQAYVDGKPAPIFPANFAFRAVSVPSGNHVVEFRYEPASFRVGAAISVVSMLAFITLAARIVIHEGTRRGTKSSL